MMSDEERAERKRQLGELADRIEREVPGLVWDRSGGYPCFGGGMPWQGDGTINGVRFYARFRHNQASLETYEGTDFIDDSTTLESAMIYPYFPEGHPNHHEHAGDLEDDEIAPFMNALIPLLAPVSEENPTSGMVLARAVEALIEAEKRGEITWTVDGRPID